MKQKKHYPIKNQLGGEYCKKCMQWSNTIGGLKDFECPATKEDIKRNKIALRLIKIPLKQ